MDNLLRWIGDPLITVPVAVLVSLIFVAAVGLCVAAWKRSRILTNLSAQIRSASGDSVVEAIDRLVHGVDCGLAEQWEEFEEGIVSTPNGAHNTMQLGEFVRNDAFLHTIEFIGFHFPFVHQLPGLATSFGILGTFLGITIGLFELGGSVTSEQIAAVIVGLASAFSTSIIGVLASIVISGLAAHVESRVIASLDDLREAVDRRIPRLTSEAILTRLEGEIGTLREQMRRHSTDIDERILEVKAEATSLLSDKRAREDTVVDGGPPRRTIYTEVATLTRELARNGQRTIDLLDRIREESEESRSFLQTLVDDLAEKFDQSINNTLAPQLEQIVGLVKGQVEQSSSTADESARRFTDEMVQRLTTTLEGSLGSMGHQVELAASRFDGVASSLDSVVATARDTVREQNEILAANAAVVQEAHARSVAATNDLSAAQELGRTFADLAATMKEDQQQLMKLASYQSRLQASATQQVDRIADTLGASVESYGASAQRMEQLLPAIEATLERVGSGLGNTMQDFGQNVSTMKGSVEDLVRNASDLGATLTGVVDRLSERIDREVALLDGYGRTTESFQSTFEQARPVLESLRSVSNELAEQRRQIQTIGNALESVGARLGTTAERTAESLGRTDGALKSSAEQLAKVVEGTEAWGSEAERAIMKFSGQIVEVLQQSLRDYDATLTHAVQNLEGAMKRLEDIAEEIAENREKRSQQ